MLHTDTDFTPILADRGMVSDALALIDVHGTDAVTQARTNARFARNQGNVLHYCRWRQIERLITQLDGEATGATIH